MSKSVFFLIFSITKKVYLLNDTLVTCYKLASHAHCDLSKSVFFLIFSITKKVYLLNDTLVTCYKLASHAHCDLLSTTWFFFGIKCDVCCNGGDNVYLIGRLESHASWLWVVYLCRHRWSSLAG